LLLDELGATEALAFAATLERPAPLWLRANPLRGDRAALAAALGSDLPAPALVPESFRGDGLERLFDSEAFAAGRFAVQDLGAQVIAHLTGAAPGERILDACAGHGGKTAHLAALADNRALLWAWDRVPSKISEAKEAFRRFGVKGATAEVRDVLALEPPADAATPLFDRILLDAPCAGLGVLRRHPEALARRAPDSLDELANTQRLLLARLAPWVKPGGTLTYAVCTFDRMETEDVVAAFLGTHPQFAVEVPTEPALAPLTDARGFLRTWPWRDDADAFFAVRFRRTRDS